MQPIYLYYKNPTTYSFYGYKSSFIVIQNCCSWLTFITNSNVRNRFYFFHFHKSVIHVIASQIHEVIFDRRYTFSSWEYHRFSFRTHPGHLLLALHITITSSFMRQNNYRFYCFHSPTRYYILLFNVISLSI